MLSAINRLRVAVNKLKAAMVKVAESRKSAQNLSTNENQWADLYSMVSNVIANYLRASKQDIKDADPQSTEMYNIAKTIVWDFSQHVNMITTESANVHNLGNFLSLMDNGAPNWPIRIIWEDACNGKVPTYSMVKKDQSSASGFTVKSTYTTRTPMPGSVNYAYPGFTSHFMWKSEGTFYASSIPFSAILNIVRSMIDSGSIPPRIGTELLAIFVFIYYELVIATYEYCEALTEYYKENEIEAKEKTHEVFKTNFNTAIPGSTVSWHSLFTRAHTEAKNTCGLYYDMLSEGSKSESVFGINPEELSRDPSQITKFLENILGVKGLTMETIRQQIPGLNDLIGNMTSFNTTPSPAAAAAAIGQ